ncbi:TVP38/TMEM64 family protein [Salinicoccus albus]|uniref:TVP38/TMEM64 family protein n=1 Tax=Salinicoccus albus TaxID=418756 RepID=UPI00035F8D5D|nr:TVP38/TMEM64 family protein [Salinicoccus albus]
MATIIIILIVFMIPLLVFFPFIQKGFILLKEGDLQNLLTWIRSWGVFAPVVSIFLMVLQAIAAPLPSFLITGANGMVFGVFWGIFISWIGAMAGAVASYYLAAVFGEAVFSKKYKEKNWLKKLEHFNGKHGFVIVLVTRLIPVVSFDLISYAAGLTRMKISHFLLGTGIGMLPATVIYTIIGHDFLQLEEYKGRLIILFLALVILFMVGLWVRKRYINKTN